MEQPTPWPSPDGTQWQQRVREADAIGEKWAVPDPTDEDDDHAQAWLATIDSTAYVGSRHHTVPRFLLERWADNNGQVRAYHRIEARHGIENVRDLAVTDFYTVIGNDGRKNSALESLMGVVEANSKPYIDAILNPFSKPVVIGAEAIANLAQFAAFQSTRTTRRRREIELRAEWYAKTMATGRIPDDELQMLTIVPHQNETIQLANTSAQYLLPYFVCRPLAIIKLPTPLLYMCDEPVVLNAPVGRIHTPDCFLTDVEVETRRKRAVRKIKKRKRGRASEIRGRTIHFSSTMPTGHGVADEILLAISPSTALLWGPLRDQPQAGPAERVALDTAEATRFANMTNEAMCAQALDWVITRIKDTDFKSRAFPEPGPLMRVCDGTNAASLAINRVPQRFRPHRLWTPSPE
jgi:hypothetical protein